MQTIKPTFVFSNVEILFSFSSTHTLQNICERSILFYFHFTLRGTFKVFRMQYSVLDCSPLYWPNLILYSQIKAIPMNQYPNGNGSRNRGIASPFHFIVEKLSRSTRMPLVQQTKPHYQTHLQTELHYLTQKLQERLTRNSFRSQIS